MFQNFLGKGQENGPLAKKNQNRKSKTSLIRQKNERRVREKESNDSPEIKNKGEASVIPSLPSGDHQTKSCSKRSYSASPYYFDPEDSDPISSHNTLDFNHYDHTKFSYKRFNSLEDFHSTFWLMLGSKRIINSEDITEIVIFQFYEPSPWGHKKQTIFFFHITPQFMVMYHHNVWLQTIHWFRRYNPDKHYSKLWTFTVTLTLNTTIQYFQWTHLGLWWFTTKLSLVAKELLVQKI